jgi:hypothetical protein
VPNRASQKLTVYVFVSILILIGLLTRVAPMFDEQRMLWQWPTEDGYLMKTIARNMAMGKGMTVADGTIPTNGTQPLTTFIWAGMFAAVDGDKTKGVLAIQIFQLLASIATAIMLFKLATKVLAGRSSHLWGGSFAALWFASPIAVDRTMNGLETGNYVLLIVSTLFYWIWVREHREGSNLHYLGIGALMGGAFLARIDAVFFIAAVTVWHVASDFFKDKSLDIIRLKESFLMGSVSVAIGSPWLLHNYFLFGSIMPTSGHALGTDIPLGQNLSTISEVLLEYLTLVLMVPSFTTSAFVGGLISLSVLIFIVYLTIRNFSSKDQNSYLLLGFLAIFFACFVVYYGLFFGAPWFLGRYFFPIYTLVALVEFKVLQGLFDSHSGRRITSTTVSASFVIVLVVISALHWRTYENIGRGSAYDHFQVASWVGTNVQPEDWVAAVQTGVLGFFHDRTINLDGKVNPEALKAVQSNEIPRYVANSKIRYLADWQGIAGWNEYQDIRDNFALVVDDKDLNLAVFARKN